MDHDEINQHKIGRSHLAQYRPDDGYCAFGKHSCSPKDRTSLAIQASPGGSYSIFFLFPYSSVSVTVTSPPVLRQQMDLLHRLLMTEEYGDLEK
jgi:hypothetical protein